MLSETLARTIDISPREIERLMTLTRKDVYHDQGYLSLVGKLDVALLHSTLDEACSAMGAGLPALNEALVTQYGLEGEPLSVYTLGYWLVNFLRSPDSLDRLVHIHSRLPAEAVREILPQLLDALEGMSAGRVEWQRALTLLSLPLAAN